MIERLMYKAPTYKGVKLRRTTNRVMYIMTTGATYRPTWFGRLCGKGQYEDIAEFIGANKVWREFPSFDVIGPGFCVTLYSFFTALRHRCED